MILTDQIEGEWGEFIFKMVDLSHIPEILEHLKENFLRDEPVMSLCPPDDKYIDFAASKIKYLLENYSHLCFIAFSKATNEIAGCQLQFKWTKKDAENGIAPHFGLPGEEIPNTRKLINKIMAPLEKPKIDIFYRFKVEAVAWNFIASTAKDYRGKGLASEMYRRLVILMKKEKLTTAFSIFTSPFSRRCAEKVGFYEIARVNIKSIVDDNGNQILANSNEDDIAAVMVLQLVHNV